MLMIFVPCNICFTCSNLTFCTSPSENCQQNPPLKKLSRSNSPASSLVKRCTSSLPCLIQSHEPLSFGSCAGRSGKPCSCSWTTFATWIWRGPLNASSLCCGDGCRELGAGDGCRDAAWINGSSDLPLFTGGDAAALPEGDACGGTRDVEADAPAGATPLSTGAAFALAFGFGGGNGGGNGLYRNRTFVPDGYPAGTINLANRPSGNSASASPPSSGMFLMMTIFSTSPSCGAEDKLPGLAEVAHPMPTEFLSPGLASWCLLPTT
mmetsp:Transcript_44702/g.103339  ORF Transcript_44702/g.103339 Transcript_44702/m.103339 type:complete len:265 (+) Transcript_44702:1350-2144(+)